jgi:multiple sugar transport system permease protein
MTSKKNKAQKVVVYILLIFLSAIMAVPFYWMLISSVKTNNEVFSIPMKWTVSEFHLKNYQDIWIKIPLLTYFKNSVKLTVITMFVQVLTSCMAAYAFAKVNFKGKNVLFLIYVTTIAVPWQVYMIPQFVIVSRLGLNNTHLGLILMQGFSAFGVFLLRQFFMEIPDELIEAAKIDGMGSYSILFRIVVPLAKPGLATLIIFTFVNVWNDFMGPLIYINSTELKTIQLGIRAFITQYGAEYALIMAASVCSLVPVVILYVFCQRFFVEGIMAGGVKG